METYKQKKSLLLEAGVAQWCSWMIGFSSPPRPDRPWGPPILLYNWYQGLFPGGGKAAGGELRTSLHGHAMPRTRTWGGTVPDERLGFC